MSTVIDSTDLGKYVAANVKRLRLAAGLTQTELGDACGVHYVNINRIERGKALPSLSLAYRLADVLQVDVDALRQVADPAAAARA